MDVCSLHWCCSESTVHSQVQPSPLSNFRMFYHPEKKPFSYDQSSPIPLTLPVPGNYSPPVSVDLPILDIWKKSHTICGFLCLASVTWHIFEIHLSYSMYWHISFYCQVIFDFTDIRHLFTYQLIDNIGCFHFLDVMNNTVNIHT